ncbi:MAG: hypothetical protein H7318_14275 [Oligoflexus sp.]|nr:hypothetical protein [Oligoflexus sp.]
MNLDFKNKQDRLTVLNEVIQRASFISTDERINETGIAGEPDQKNHFLVFFADDSMKYVNEEKIYRQECLHVDLSAFIVLSDMDKEGCAKEIKKINKSLGFPELSSTDEEKISEKYFQFQTDASAEYRRSCARMLSDDAHSVLNFNSSYRQFLPNLETLRNNSSLLSDETIKELLAHDLEDDADNEYIVSLFERFKEEKEERLARTEKIMEPTPSAPAMPAKGRFAALFNAPVPSGSHLNASECCKPGCGTVTRSNGTTFERKCANHK